MCTILNFKKSAIHYAQTMDFEATENNKEKPTGNRS